MIILDTLLLGSIKFVLDKIAAAVDAELHDDTALKEDLLAAQMRLEMGELSDEEYAAIERQILDAIRAVRARRRGDETDGAMTITGVDARAWTDDETDEDGGDAPRR